MDIQVTGLRLKEARYVPKREGKRHTRQEWPPGGYAVTSGQVRSDLTGFLSEEPESHVTLPGTLLGREIIVKGLGFHVTQILARNKSCDFVFLPLSLF